MDILTFALVRFTSGTKTVCALCLLHGDPHGRKKQVYYKLKGSERIFTYAKKSVSGK